MKSLPFDTICYAAYDAAYTALKAAVGSTKALGYAGINKAKQVDYRAYRHLVKPSLTYLSVIALASSATMYLTESRSQVQNISNEIPAKVEIPTKEVEPIEKVENQLSVVKTHKDLPKGLPSHLHSEFWCLKVLGWNEIRNGSEHAMKAVYSVVENRKNSGAYPSDYCSIMKQHKQFSFWNQGKYNLAAIEPRPRNAKDIAALKKIEHLSLKVVTGKFNPVLPRNVLWYSTPAARNAKGSMHWTQQYRIATQAGPHLFYTKPLQSI